MKNLAMELPLGHESVHQCDEVGVVGRLHQMDEFVENNVFEALRWLLGQLGIEANRACLVVTAPPLGLHPLHEEPLQSHAQQRLPSRQQCRHSLPQLLSIPFLYKCLSLVLICSWTHPQKHAAVL